MPDDFWSSLGSTESYLKFLIVFLSYPAWGPVMKVMWQEIQTAMSPEGGVYGHLEKKPIGRRPAGLDPWVNIPLAKRRGQGASPMNDVIPSQAPPGGKRPSQQRRGQIQSKQGGAASRRTRPVNGGAPRRRGF